MYGLDAAATGMQAQQLAIDVISNNLANLSTVAYKRRVAAFQDLLYVHKALPGVNYSAEGEKIPRGIEIGLGTRISEVYRINEIGKPIDTGSPLDLMILGKGYLRFAGDDGSITYSRDGTLGINADGAIVNSSGSLLQPEITVPENTTKLTINKNGEVFAEIPGAIAPELLGQIELANFVNEGGLKAIGNNLFIETESSGPEVTGVPGSENFGPIMQGTKESSNVDPIFSTTELIKALRAYEMNSRALKINSESWKTANNVQVS